MSSPSDAENLEIDPSGGQNFAFVLLTVGKHFRAGDKTIRHVDIFRRQINVIEKLHLHKVAVTFRMMRRQSIVFIEIERHNVPEGELLLAVQSDQFSVKLDRCRACGEPENGCLAFVLAPANQLGN